VIVQVDGAYVTRMVDPLLDRVLAEVPAVFLTGPRAVGKTTTAVRRAATLVRLDDPQLAAAWSSSPDVLLARSPTPVVLDEWQYVPEVIGAVKRAVDTDPSPGRVIITGSASAEQAPSVWPGVGRLVRIPMWGITQAEARTGSPRPFLDRLALGHWEASVRADLPTLPDYVEMAAAGQFPAARALSDVSRRLWTETYVDDLVSRDVVPVGGRRDPGLLRRYLVACAELSATTSSIETYLNVVGVNRTTATAYEAVLTGLGVLDVLPAWHDHRLKRLTRTPKRVLVDTSLMTALLRADVGSLLADGRLLGRVLETFVVAQLRPEVVVAQPAPALHHLRSEKGRHEIDIVVDLGAGRVAGIEVKATAAPRTSDAAHLAWLRDAMGLMFVGGVVLHTGPGSFPLGDRIWALPIATLWT
jgi:hypothetical protein